MGKRGLGHKKVLGVDKEMSFLSSLEAEVSKAYPQVQFYKTTTYEDSLQMMLSLTFDLFISEIRKEPGSALIDLAISLKLPILALTNGAESHEILNCINGTPTWAIASKKNSKEIVPKIDQLLRRGCSPGWKRLLVKAGKIPNWMISRLSSRNLYGDSPEKSFFY